MVHCVLFNACNVALGTGWRRPPVRLWCRLTRIPGVLYSAACLSCFILCFILTAPQWPLKRGSPSFLGLWTVLAALSCLWIFTQSTIFNFIESNSSQCWGGWLYGNMFWWRSRRASFLKPCKRRLGAHLITTLIANECEGRNLLWRISYKCTMTWRSLPFQWVKRHRPRCSGCGPRSYWRVCYIFSSRLKKKNYKNRLSPPIFADPWIPSPWAPD